MLITYFISLILAAVVIGTLWYLELQDDKKVRKELRSVTYLNTIKCIVVSVIPVVNTIAAIIMLWVLIAPKLEQLLESLDSPIYKDE